MDDKLEIERLLESNEVENKIKLSYSRISDFDRNGINTLVKRSVVNSDGSTMGSVIDDLLNDTINKTNTFEELYYIFDGDKPTASLGILADLILENYDKVPSQKTIAKLASDNNLWSNIKKEEVFYSKFDVPEFWDYLTAQYASKDKELITTEQYIWGSEIRDILLIHENSKNIFDTEDEIINQVKFEYEYEDFLFRGILDILKINHKDKTVRMIDLKTGKNSVHDFSNSFIKWRYYLQEGIYRKSFDKIKEMFGLKDYKLLPFQFLYISRYERIPFVYEITKKWEDAAWEGFSLSNGWDYRGLNELLKEIKWHKDNDVYHLSKKLYEAKGIMKLEDDFIKLK